MTEETKPAADLGAPKRVPERPSADPKKPEGPKKKTPDAWAKKLGHFHSRNPAIPQSVDYYGWQHAAADKLYGWSDHAYNHQAEPFELTEEDYAKALDAAAKYPTVAPHAPAIPPSRKDLFKDFQPCASRRDEAKQ